MILSYKRPFAQYVKKARKPLQLAIEDAVENVRGDPEIGEMKVGDLTGIRVYKFRFNRQEYLMAFRPLRNDLQIEILAIDFYQIGSHENFYEELKNYLRHERTGATQ